jgi:predicted ABC-type sugar transport system permease subunit
LLLSLFCFPAFFRRYQAEALYIGMIGITWLLIHAKLAGNWHGQFSWGPKHFITITPLVAIPFLVCGREVFRPAAKVAFAGISLSFGFLLAVAAIIGNPHYRLEFAYIRGTDEHRFIWSPTESQSVDMLRSSSRNVARMFANVPWDVVPKASAMDQHASNTANVWLLTAYHEGVPAIVVVLTAVLLLSLLICCVWFLLRPPQVGQHIAAEFP